MVTATAIPDATMEDTASSYAAARDQLSEFLIRATLIESYHSFARHAKPYPFASRESLQPGVSTSAYEHPFQRSALILMVDGALPANLRKHIRFRPANEFNVPNLSRLAPEIAPEIAKASQPPHGLSMNDKGFLALLDRLLDMDYALLMQRLNEAAPISLSHIHVKVERLTDNAVRMLARDLGYIRRTLYEKGEAHTEILERKFYEYFGFAANASGRKCAAAMAAQLLAVEVPHFVVFASCQEDCRLTVLDESDLVSHHLLIQLDADTLRRSGAKHPENYTIKPTAGGGDAVVCYRARFRRTSAARVIDVGSSVRPDSSLQEPWLEIAEEDILPLPGHNAPVLPYRWHG